MTTQDFLHIVAEQRERFLMRALHDKITHAEERLIDLLQMENSPSISYRPHIAYKELFFTHF